jgi:hypothetical protein
VNEEVKSPLRGCEKYNQKGCNAKKTNIKYEYFGDISERMLQREENRNLIIIRKQEIPALCYSEYFPYKI